MKYVWIFLFLAGACFANANQNKNDTSNNAKPRLYVDCPQCDNYGIDFDELLDFFRTELTFTDYVRDRKESDIHVLITMQRAGSGGTEYTLSFMGQGQFSNMNDTLTYNCIDSDSDDTIRKGLLQKLKLGLIRIAARTPVADKLTINCEKQETTAEETVDKWNNWVFEISMNSWFNGEKIRKEINIWSDLSASRITDDWKIELGLSGSYQESRYETETFRELSISRYKSAYGQVIRSLSDHWSLAFSGNVHSSTYSNIKISSRLGTGIEYDLFPYSESTRRLLRFSYLINETYVDYEEETIYDEHSEWLTSQSMSVQLDIIQPWGSATSRISASNYYHDFSKYRLRLFNNVSLRLVKGLSLNIRGSFSKIHDQISLPKEGATEEEILLQRKELATSYSYWGSVGISYSFGSIYNNIVNPRFGN